MRSALAAAPTGDQATVDVVAGALEGLEEAVEVWQGLDPVVAEARLFPLAALMVDVYAGALLLEQAGREAALSGGDRKTLLARLYARRHLAPSDRLGGVAAPPEELERFKELVDGSLVDPRR